MKTSEIKIHVPANGNELLENYIKELDNNVEVYTLWRVLNVNAIDRLQMTDHGPVHFQIVANIALRLARILKKNKIKTSVEKDYGLSHKHAELIIFLASIYHDLGMSISREGHEGYSLILTNNILRESLSFLPIDERTIVISEVLHAIISHRKGGVPYTLEAGIVRVADALDMSEGRSRIPYKAGHIDIHSVSAAAINRIVIDKGEIKPIRITIEMNNSAGIFQTDDLLKGKIKGSGLEKYIEVKAYVVGAKEKSLVKELEIQDL